MTDAMLYSRLYDKTNGGPPRSFVCEFGRAPTPLYIGASACGRVCRTERGMLLHLWLVHRTKCQMGLFDVRLA